MDVAKEIRTINENWETLYKEYGENIYKRSIAELYDQSIPKPTIIYSPEAYAKVKALISHSAIEIGWHGLVNKIDDLTFLIYDILVYPQTCSAANITTDDEAYTKWLHSFPDHIFNKIRYQGHSHVNMGVSPSGVDEHFYKDLTKNLKKDDFYIFGIHNKRGDQHSIVFDRKRDLYFEGKSVKVDIGVGGEHSQKYAQKNMEQYVTYKQKEVKKKDELKQTQRIL